MAHTTIRVEKVIVFVLLMALLLGLAITATEHTGASEMAPSAFSSAQTVD